MAKSSTDHAAKRTIIDLTDDADTPPFKVQKKSVNASRRAEPPAILPPGAQSSNNFGNRSHASSSAPLNNILPPALNARDYALGAHETAYPPSSLASYPTASSSSQVTIDLTEDGAENELMPQTQGMDRAGFGFTQFGAIDEKIVGIQYYHGYASPGEVVLVRREPSNKYDPNAIKVENVRGSQIGHIPRTSAAKLAPYMDSHRITVEGRIGAQVNVYSTPITLHLFGSVIPEIRDKLEADLKRDGLKMAPKKRWQDPKKKVKIEPTGRKKIGLKSSQSTAGADADDPLVNEDGPDIADLINGSERLRPRDIEELAEQWGTSEDALEKMPKASQPTKIKATLLPYQLQGLAWMLSMESPKLPPQGSTDVIQLWKRSTDRNGHFVNIATNFSTDVAPPLASGGILSDDMGLGKTLQVITLIVQGSPGTTLIVAPLSVMSNWSQQIERHVKEEHSLKVLTYHGGNRNRKGMTAKEFGEYDVVITTYGLLSTECFGGKQEPSKHKNGLYSMKWRRVVLDEGHQIRNRNTKAAGAARMLDAESRWVLTGTPIVNSIKDLHSMLEFIRITGGLECYEIFNSVLARPLLIGDPHAEALLHSIMRTMCLRRKKDMRFVDLKLPELSQYVHRISFRSDEQKKYDAILAEAKGLLSKIEKGKDKFAYRNVLEMLLRLRQVCCHWKLGGKRVSDLVAQIDSQEVVELNNENKIALQALLQLSIEAQDECPICLETLHNPVITACKHAFGEECISRTIEHQHKCPLCRAPIDTADNLIHPAEEGSMEEEETEIDPNTQSSKTEALMSILKASRKDRASKVVIFSQWTSFLNIIQAQLDNANYKYTRIDGSMPAPARDAAMTALATDPDCKIMLASLAVCSVGLNLVAADTVILADSWWAPAIEDQAVDRVYRLGQERKTTVWRLVIQDSIEERVLSIQKEKRELVGKAFKEKGRVEKNSRLRDLQILLGGEKAPGEGNGS